MAGCGLCARLSSRLPPTTRCLSPPRRPRGIAPDVPRKHRRWWKGLGQIAEGAALAVADVGIAVGAFKLPVSPETQTYGLVVSAAAGMGKIMNGLGDLRGE